MKYKIEFYQNVSGYSPVWEFPESLRTKSVSNKNARIQYKQATLHIQLLEDNGTHLPENITKHIENDIWELRPGNNRIFYFYHKDNTYVPKDPKTRNHSSKSRTR